jgi:hypothetical protein
MLAGANPAGKKVTFTLPGGAGELKIGSAVKVAFLVEMFVDRDVDGNKFLQTFHTPEPKHCPLPSSKRQVRILPAVVQPAARFLPFGIADYFHCSTLGSQVICHDHIWIPKAFQ